jgi:mannose/cellobiose epimerase-like protein (N-acyl-D-glucosamine 2-epimerase family)
MAYSDLYIAYGLQEYSRAAGDEYWHTAKELMLKCVEIYDTRHGYASLKATETSSEVVRPRIFSHWFQLGRLALHMLEKRQDSQVQAIADRCIDAVMNAHFNPEFRLLTEYVNHDLSRIDGDYGHEITTHAQDMLWLVMLEAVRRGDKALFDTAVDRFKRHVEVLWDDVYGGLFTLKHADKNIWNTNKPLWLQVEVLFGSLTMLELTGDPWALKWFERMYAYVRDAFYLGKHGLPLWMDGGDRKVTFAPHTKSVGIFQQPRHLMLNLVTLNRMIENGGRITPVFG